MKPGDKVKFTGCSETQRYYGNHGFSDDLTEGEEYIVSGIRVFDWHTKVWIEGKKGHYNSVCFEELIHEAAKE